QLHGSGGISNGITASFGARLNAGYAAAQGLQPRAGFHALPYPDYGPEALRLLDLVTQLGADALGTELEFPLTPEDHAELERCDFAAGLEAGRYFCIHPGARLRDKCWSPQRFAEVADTLARETGLAVVLTGSHKETDLTRAVAEHMQTPAIDSAGPISIGA